MNTVTPKKNKSRARARRPHKTVPVQYGNREADIDRKIAPLIREMWQANIETYQSCQANPRGYIWLQFFDQWELAKFLNIIGEFDPAPDSRFARMEYGYGRREHPRRGQWFYEVVVTDWSVEEVELADSRCERRAVGDRDFIIATAVHFPSRELPWVLARLTEHNRRHAEITRGDDPAAGSDCSQRFDVVRSED